MDCYQRYIKGIEKKGIKEEGGRRGGGGEEIDTTDSYRHFLLFFFICFYRVPHGTWANEVASAVECLHKRSRRTDRC